MENTPTKTADPLALDTEAEGEAFADADLPEAEREYRNALTREALAQIERGEYYSLEEFEAHMAEFNKKLFSKAR